MSGPLAGTLWNIPYQRNPFFTGREDILSRLDRALHAEQRVALSQPQGISGLGGVGKTQAVVEYAYRHREEYNAVLWVRADSVTSLTSSMVELAQVLELTERHEKNQELIVQAVLRWLRLHSDWLLIYDNIDDLSLAEPFLPKAGAGHLLFTTRAHALGGLAQRLDIQQMEPEIGALLLLRRASLLSLQATLNMANPDEQQLAQVISQEVDGLPLALDQAGAYIKETPCPLSEYLARYRTRRSELLHIRGRFDQDYPASVATTWSLSFEKVQQAHLAASELLHFSAFLAPDAIPEKLLTTGSPYLGRILAPVVAHPLQFDRVCSEILRFSLMQRGRDEQTLTIHRLVQSVLRDNMSEEERYIRTEQTIAVLDNVLPSNITFEHWLSCEQYLPHAQTCVQLTARSSVKQAWVLQWIGNYLLKRQRTQEAESYVKQALQIREHYLGKDHPDTATSLDRLAYWWELQGQYGEAEPLYQRALAIREQQLGTNHFFTAVSLNNLAGLFRQQGQYKEAEALYQRALAIREQLVGTNHLLTAHSLNNLACVYVNQGRYTEAETFYQRALSIRESQLRASHPDIAQSLSNLAVLLTKQGRDSEAEALYQRSLEIQEETLGIDHPDTATALNNLAISYENQGRYTEAETLYKRALNIYEEKWGIDHPDTANSLHNLAHIYQQQQRYEEAEVLYRRALVITERLLGTDHPETAACLNSLALLYHDQKRYEEAELLYKRALLIRQIQLGDFHPDTAVSLNNLARSYVDRGWYKEAESVLKFACLIWQRCLGESHPQTQAALEGYELLLQLIKLQIETESQEEKG